ncbi:hypothetical protein V8E51_007120 [Hyaloscypha variabilis]
MDNVLMALSSICLLLATLLYWMQTQALDAPRYPETSNGLHQQKSEEASGCTSSLLIGCLLGIFATIYLRWRRRAILLRADDVEIGFSSSGSNITDEHILTLFGSDNEIGYDGDDLTDLSDIDIGYSGPNYRAKKKEEKCNFSMSFAPSAIWKPTERERDLVASQTTMPALNTVPPFSSQVHCDSEESQDDGHSENDEEEMCSTTHLTEASTSPTHHNIPKSISPPLQSRSKIPECVPELARPEPEIEAHALRNQFQCPNPSCSRTFTQQFKLNHHLRYHQKPKQCPTCSKNFGITTHLERHINSAHLSTKIWYCPNETCKYSRAAGKGGFARKDNWRRHVKGKHSLTVT